MDARARLLRAAVGFALVPPTEPGAAAPPPMARLLAQGRRRAAIGSSFDGYVGGPLTAVVVARDGVRELSLT